MLAMNTILLLQFITYNDKQSRKKRTEKKEGKKCDKTLFVVDDKSDVNPLKAVLLVSGKGEGRGRDEEPWKQPTNYLNG